MRVYSEIPEAERGRTSNYDLLSLWAVKCNSEFVGWCGELNEDEFIRAVRISLLELNGFPEFLSDLESNAPLAVEKVFSNEAKLQLELVSKNLRAPLLHDVVHSGSSFLQRIVAKVVAAEFSTELAQSKNQDVNYAIQIVGLQGTGEDIIAVVEEIKSLIAKDDLDSDALTFWIGCLSLLDLKTACDLMIVRLADVQPEDETAVSLFGNMFGERHDQGRLSFDSIDLGVRPELLKELLVLAYRTVPPCGDLVHHGTYSPTQRDNAERARSVLFEALVNTNAIETISIIRELSTLPQFSHMKDRLKQIGTEVAARVSESPPMTAADFQKLDKECYYIPNDSASLFEVMINRLDDFEQHLLYDQFSTVDALRMLDQEIPVRRFISNWMNNNSRNAFKVDQEAVVHDEKRTDIRLNATSADMYATIEVKLDDSRFRWSGSDLQDALINQLIGQYLNHERSQVGCLLICLRERRMWENPNTRQKMDLVDTVAWLQSIADGIVAARPELHIVVKGIDYTDISD